MNQMKKLLLVLIAFTFSLGAMAQTGKMQDNKMQKEKMHGKDHIMMTDGKMMMKKDGKKMAMDKEMTMSDGTIVTTQGKVTMKNGQTMMMKNGDKMDMDGMMMKKEHSKMAKSKMKK